MSENEAYPSESAHISARLQARYPIIIELLFDASIDLDRDFFIVLYRPRKDTAYHYSCESELNLSLLEDAGKCYHHFRTDDGRVR